MFVLDHDKELQKFLDFVYVKSHSSSTINSYKLSIINKKKTGFRDFLQKYYNCDELELVSKINKEEIDVFQILNEFVVFLDKLKYKPKSIQLRLTAVKGYLRNLGLRIYSEDFKHRVRLPKIQIVREEPPTKDMICRILRNVSPKIQTIILVLVASGMRIGELVQLTLSDIDFESKPTRIRIRAETTKTSEQRETFLTEEATKSLKDYLSRFYGWKEGSQNNPKNMTIFGRTSLTKTGKTRVKEIDLKNPSSYTASNLLIKELANAVRKVPELNEKNSNGRNVIHYHALRKFFRTQVGNVAGRDFAEALMGRRFYLDQYYNNPADENKKKYLEVEPFLIITDFKIVEKNYEKLTERHERLEDKVDGLFKYLQEKSIPIPDSLK